MENKKYFKVIAKCGHVGRMNYVPIAFAVVATSGHEAAQRTKEFPRVKKQLKLSIISCDEIDYNEYKELRELNDNDPYLKCTCKQEQLKIEGFKERIVHIDFPNKYKKSKRDRSLIEFKFRKRELKENWR